MSLAFPADMVPTNTTLDSPRSDSHGHGHPDGRSDGCMFCLGRFDPEHSLDGDGVRLSEHLASNDSCRNQWRIWKDQIVDEWNGD